MTIRVLLLAAAGVVLGGCAGAPDYPPPIQRPAELAAEGNPVGRFVNMNDVWAEAYIVRDIQDTVEGTGWRWTHEHPELRFLVDRTQGLKFVIDFSFPEPNFKQTGPVTVSFWINGQLLDRVRYTAFGDKHFEKRVPAAWLRAGEYTRFRADVDPPWIAPSDKARLGFVLFRAGFRE